jgi:UDP-2,4-diacetamido-2,4,6-trideoxy-beta-L-altropyranose hydrolase
VILEDAFDVAELLTIIEHLQPAGIVIDGYQFDEHYRQSLFACGLPVIAMDDGTLRHPLHADVIVNVSPLASAEDYENIGAGARLLLGPAYTPLRNEFRQCEKASESVSPKEGHVLITFGGSDPLNLTLPVVETLLDKLPERVIFDVVVGGAITVTDDLNQLSLKHSDRINIHNNTSEMATVMRRASMAISAAGSTLWELAYLVVPTIAIVVVDNQAKNLKAPVRNWFGTIDARNNTKNAIDQMTAASQTLWNNNKTRKDLSAELSKIKVGEKVSVICEIFEKPFKRPA